MAWLTPAVVAARAVALIAVGLLLHAGLIEPEAAGACLVALGVPKL